MLRFKHLVLLILIFISFHLHATQKPALQAETLKEISRIELNADGINTGKSAYDLIRDFGGKRPIESPDLYPVNHPSVAHIYEAKDDEIGNHFVFTLHRDEDMDRNRFDMSDRQRNEIKVYDKSRENLKGYKNDIMEYQWAFKINNGMEVSKHFSHWFQLKAVDGGVGAPILTFTGRQKGDNNYFEIRHQIHEAKQVLVRKSLEDFVGEWLLVTCRVAYANEGFLFIDIQRQRDGKQLLNVNMNNIAMWRSTQDKHFVRPKWGMYRSLKEKSSLRKAEEQIAFANFVVKKLAVIDE